MGRYFNIGGPCNPADHYTLPAPASPFNVITEAMTLRGQDNPRLLLLIATDAEGAAVVLSL